MNRLKNLIKEAAAAVMSPEDNKIFEVKKKSKESLSSYLLLIMKNSHYGSEEALERTAKHFKMSPGKAATVFKKEFGKSYKNINMDDF